MAYIAFYITDLQGGGAERACVNAANCLAAIGHRVQLVVNVDEGRYINEIAANVEKVVLGARGPFQTIKRLEEFLRNNEPETLCAFLNQPSVFSVIAKKRAKVKTRIVISMRSLPTMEAAHSKSLKLKAMPFFLKIYGPQADGCICVSEASKEDYCNLTGVPPSKVDIVYNAIIDENLLAGINTKSDHPWFGGDQPPVILGAGRLRLEKNYESLVRAFATVRAKTPCRLMILGEGPERENLLGLAAELGVAEDFSLPGFVNPPFGHMAAAKCFVLCSLYEGLPGVLIQSLAMGTPVVATDSPGGSREVVEGGKLGKLVPVKDDTALSEAIYQVLGGNHPVVTLEDLRRFTMDAAAIAFEWCLVANDRERNCT